MTVKNQELYNIIETLPEEILSKVLEYIDYLKYVSVMNNAPQDLIIKDKADLRRKLEEGIKDSESGNIYSIDETFSEIETILAQ